MKHITFLACLTFLSIYFSACGGSESAPAGTNVVMKTDKGNIYIKLFDDTPKHKENFLKLAKEGFFNGIEFHRVIPNFMVQAGNPDTKPDKKREEPLKDNDAGYKIDAEIVPAHINVRGVLAAARDGNPQWQSSGSQFYIVTGKKVSESLLDTAEMNTTMVMQQKMGGAFMQENPNIATEQTRMQEFAKKNQMDSVEAIRKRAMDQFQAFLASKNFQPFKYTPEQRKTYLEKGGYPTLDGQYTVFGEVLKGIEVADEISKVPTEGEGSRPKEAIRIISTEVIK